MSRNIWKAFVLCGFVSVIITGCDLGQQPQPVLQQPLPMPQAPVVQQTPPQPVAPPAPPPTPLVPIAEVDNSQSAQPGKRPKIPGKIGIDDVDKPLPGAKTEGDELIGNYSCRLDSDGLPLGPFKLPAMGCRIYRSDDGKLKLGPTSKSMASIKGQIQNPTQVGFFVTGGFKFPGNELRIKTRMQRKPGAQVQYAGNGKGTLNADKSKKIKYRLSMVKK